MNRIIAKIQAIKGIHDLRGDRNIGSEEDWLKYRKLALDTYKNCMIADFGFYNRWQHLCELKAMRPRLIKNGLMEEEFADLLHCVKTGVW